MSVPRRGAAGACLLLSAAALALAGAGSAALAAGPEGGLDARAWELVSPAAKNGGAVQAPGALGGGAAQAAALGGALAYGSASSFAGGVGAAPSSQYLASRSAAGWATQNLTPPLLSDTYAAGAYSLFSTDLSRALLTNGWSCRDGAPNCPAANPPLGAGAPSGYRNLYLRQGNSYEPLITTANAPALSVDAEDFALSLEGASADLGQVAFESCAALTPEAVEVPGPEGCDPAAANLYLWSGGSLAAINLLPGQSTSAPGASLAAPAGAISADGARVYWRGADGNLYLREGNETVQADADAGGGGELQVASTNGSVAYFTVGGHLYRYLVATDTATDLTPAGGVAGVLGAAADGASVYYLAATGLYLWHAGASVKVAAAADAVNYPPATGTARVSADGEHLAFVSSAVLTGFVSAGKPEVYLYDAGTAKLTCVSCNSRGDLPLGPASIPAAREAGEAPLPYKPRALSADGSRVFFDSADILAIGDTDGLPDAYQWVAKGTAGCAKAAGCVGLLSGGRIGSASFLDASADGADAFFTTATPLLGADTDLGPDVYDARAGGGLPEAPRGIECFGDDCQGPAPAPAPPLPPTSYLQAPGNPPLRFAGAKKPGKKKHAKKRHGGGKAGGKGRKHAKGAKNRGRR